jgi:outer membrane protein assembly factor BamB
MIAMTRTRWIGIGIALALVAAIGAAVAYHVATSKTGDVHNGASEPFTLTTDPTTTAPATKTGPDYGPDWPTYGRTLDRNRDASDLTSIHPPYRIVWKNKGGGLLEYPPTYSHGVIYEAADSGWVTARSVFTGNIYWSHKLATVLASPTLGPKLMYLPSYDGNLYALSRATGKTVWKTHLGGDIEGSPALWHGRVYEGTLSGTMRSFNAANGHQLWSLTASGAVKQGPAIVAGRLYFGDYGGTMWCVHALSGHVIWKTHTAGLSSGYRSGSFFSTPAVAYGRVYIGNTDGKVYSFAASNGQVAWTVTLPNWAYGSPAVSDGRVFATSYDGTIIALNARTGSTLWRHVLPYGTLASPVVVGPYVYVADRGKGAAYKGQLFAYTPKTGKRVWSFPDGKYSSVVAGAGRLIVAGFFELYVLKPH